MLEITDFRCDLHSRSNRLHTSNRQWNPVHNDRQWFHLFWVWVFLLHIVYFPEALFDSGLSGNGWYYRILQDHSPVLVLCRFWHISPFFHEVAVYFFLVLHFLHNGGELCSPHGPFVIPAIPGICTVNNFNDPRKESGEVICNFRSLTWLTVSLFLRPLEKYDGFPWWDWKKNAIELRRLEVCKRFQNFAVSISISLRWSPQFGQPNDAYFVTLQKCRGNDR